MAARSGGVGKGVVTPQAAVPQRVVTLDDLVANPFSKERVGDACEDRDKWALELYEHNLQELTKIMNGGRGMWCVRLNAIGAIEESWRCKISDRPGHDCFNIFMPGKGSEPRFGHSNMLSGSQLTVYPIMERDAKTIAGAQERAHTARRLGLENDGAEETVRDLTQRFKELPPSATALAEQEEAEAAAAVQAERERELAALEEDVADMPSFEGLMAAFQAEDEGRTPAPAVEPSAKKKNRRKGRRKKGGATTVTVEGAEDERAVE